MTLRSPTSSSSGLVRFLAECGAFGLALLLMHAGIYALRGSQDVPHEVQLLRNVVRTGDADVLYIGDSTLFMGLVGEPDSRNLPTMLHDLLPDVTVAEISSAAGQVELYELYAAYLSRHPNSVRVVVLPLNLRMLAPQLEQHSYRYFDKEQAFLEADSALFDILYRPLAAFKAFNHRTASAAGFELAPVLDGPLDLGPLGPFNPAISIAVTPEQRARIITFSYMFELDRSNRAMIALESIFRCLNDAEIGVVPYVTPIDMEWCTKDLGPRFRDRIESNVDMLRKLAEAHGVAILDLSGAVSHDHFAWEHYPNEHLDAAGRRRVAELLAPNVATALGQDP